MNYLYTHILYPCDLTTGTVQCDYSPDLLALYLPLYQHWSPLSSTLKKIKYSSWYGIHKGNFLQLNTTINKCSYQGIVWQHQHDTCTKIWKKHCLNAASKWTKYDGLFSRYYRYTYMLNVHYCKLKSCW